jgi:niacin transporter
MMGQITFAKRGENRMKSKNTLNMTIGSLLLALSLMIPMVFGGVLSLTLGPFTATLASHTPTFISMLFGPTTAAVVGLGSAIGFFFRLGPIVGIRAAMHIPVGVVGAILLQKKFSYPIVLGITAPIHAALEALIVLLFRFSLQEAGYAVAVGTLVHHALDSVISLACWRLLRQLGFLKVHNALGFQDK